MEEYWPKWEPTWPVNFSVTVKSKKQADTLARDLSRVERYLRRGIPKGNFKHWDLADRLAVARRKLQKAMIALDPPKSPRKANHL